jgi:hypothetical protein
MKKLLGIAFVLLLVLAAIGATVAFAAPAVQTDDTEEATPPGESDGFGQRTGPCGLTREVLQQIVDRQALAQVVADTLGLTVEELQEARESGTRLLELAEEQDVDPAEIRAAVKAAVVEMIQDAADDGLITAEQAECILNHEGGRCRIRCARCWRLDQFRRGLRQNQDALFNEVFGGSA